MLSKWMSTRRNLVMTEGKCEQKQKKWALRRWNCVIAAFSCSFYVLERSEYNRNRLQINENEALFFRWVPIRRENIRLHVMNGKHGEL